MDADRARGRARREVDLNAGAGLAEDGGRRAVEADDTIASAVVAAVRAYAKINAAGEWIDRSETVSLNDLFDRMSTHSRFEAYAQTGALPEWFKTTVSAD